MWVMGTSIANNKHLFHSSSFQKQGVPPTHNEFDSWQRGNTDNIFIHAQGLVHITPGGIPDEFFFSKIFQPIDSNGTEPQIEG